MTQVKIDDRVAIANLEVITAEALAKGDISFMFKADYVAARRAPPCEGVVERWHAGHHGNVAVVRHDDGALAVYHVKELVAPGAQTAASEAMETVSPPAPAASRVIQAVPDRVLKVGSIDVEVYTQVDPSSLPCVVLMAPLPSNVPEEERTSSLLHKGIKVRGNGFHHRYLDHLKARSPDRQGWIIGHPPGFPHDTPFGAVFFINGNIPEAAIITNALKGVNACEATSTVVPLQEFLHPPVNERERAEARSMSEEQVRESQLQFFLGILDIAFDGQQPNIKTIKVVL